MPSKVVLVVPTYNYLSYPIVEKLGAIKHDDTELVCLEFYQPRADFGPFPETPLFSRVQRIHPDKTKPGILEMRYLRRRLINYLEDLNPQCIVTFSDVTFFARCVKGTRFESLLLIIQPCLLSAQPPTPVKRVIYGIGRLLNKIFACPIYRERHYWGELLNQASYCIWSNVEQKTRKMAGKICHCGNFFFDLPDVVFPLEDTDRVLVLVPDLPYYVKSELESLVVSFSRLLRAWPSITFEFKYHPRNADRLPLSDHPNYQELCEFSIPDVARYDMIVSAYSNLAVTLRCLHPKVIIFDLGWYADSGIPYLGPEFFRIPKSGDSLLEHFVALKEESRAVEANDYLSTLFSISPGFAKCIEEYFSAPKGLGES